MPELPEVETIVRACRPQLVGRRIRGFSSSWRRNVSPSAARVKRELTDRLITGVERRGKLLIFHLEDDAHLLLHLRMSGRLEWADQPDGTPRHVRAVWKLDNGRQCLFCDPRKFGTITYTRDLASATAGLGLEPLGPSFTARALGCILHQRQRQLKPLLLDQSLIAGLGNIYTDETLAAARLHPLTRSNTVTDPQVVRLHRAIRRILRFAIRLHGTSVDWIYPGGRMQRHLTVYGRTGQPCRRCRTPIVSFRVGQRGTHICPKCQPAPVQR